MPKKSPRHVEAPLPANYDARPMDVALMQAVGLMPDRLVRLVKLYARNPITTPLSALGMGPRNAHELVEWLNLTADVSDLDFLRACVDAEVSLSQDGFRRLEALESQAPSQKSVTACGADRSFSGCTCADVSITVRMDGVNVKRIENRGLGTEYTLSDLSMKPGDVKHRALMEMGKSSAGQNMVGYPRNLSGPMLTRFCKAFRDATGISDNLLSRRGKALISNAGRLSWSEDTQHGPHQERSNQAERIARAANT